MGKIKELIMTWGEMFDSGIEMEYTVDYKNWFDAVDAPQFNDGKWYREKTKSYDGKEYSANEDYLPKD